MSDYTPDRWVCVKITDGNSLHAPVYKIFASWFGGWAGSDSWKLNSGITKAGIENDVYSFEGSSGSVYYCHKNNYGANLYGSSVLDGIITKSKNNGVCVEIMPEQTNWLELEYD